MQILNLNLTDFRNYQKLNIDFGMTTNLIIGKNGSGKTNLIEAIYILSITKSFRGTLDNVVIANGKDQTNIKGEILNKLKTAYELEISKNGKKSKINGKKINKLSDYISNLNVILLNPDDLYLIKSTPTIRRKLLNVEISQLNNKYLKDLNQYNILLKQRNSYLKTMYINSLTSKDYLNILTDKVIDYGKKIYLKRKKFIDQLNEEIGIIFKNITGISGLKIKYQSDYNQFTHQKIVDKYKKNFERDLILGKTSIGIHHDDIKFILNNEILKDYGSEGQQKIAILSLKLAELKIFYKEKGNYPILILDDLFSEIDNEKINKIMKLLNKDIQIFITVTDLDKINKKFLKNSKIYEIVDGEIKNGE